MDTKPSQSPITPNDASPEKVKTTPASKWKPRSRSGKGSSRRGKGKGTGPRGRKLTAQQQSERLMISLCVVLGFCVVGFAGFALGKKTTPKHPASESSISMEIVVSSENQEKINTAFSDMRSGNAKRALLQFQGVQASQPGAYGIDFLVGYAAYFADEPVLARESFQTAIGKKELDVESAAFLALIDVSNSSNNPEGASIVDPVAAAESALQLYDSRRPLDPRPECLYAELLRSKGSYRTAVELMTKALGRTDPSFDARLIEAKILLAHLQNEPPKEVPPSSSMDSMDGPKALAAAFSAFTNKQPEDGILFLNKASEFYPGRLFAEVLKDQAFDEFRQDPKFAELLKKY